MYGPSPRGPADRAGLERGAAVSLLLHATILASMIFVFPHPLPPPPPPEDTVAVEFEGHSDHAQKGEHMGKVAAPTDTDAEAHDNPAKVAPTKAPLETAPPPPPPPPPPPQVEKTEVPPVEQVAPPPKPTPAPTPVKPPPPPVKVKPVPTPPTPVKSVTSQPNVVKKPVVDTHALENTLQDLLADQQPKEPPKHRYNPERGGKVNGGGAKSGGLTGELSDGQRKQIGDDVRRCYAEDTAAKDYATYSATMTVTIDATGEVRDVKLSDRDQALANSNPAFRAFAERAQRAVLDPECSKLAIPADLLGKPSQELQFLFRP